MPRRGAAEKELYTSRPPGFLSLRLLDAVDEYVEAACGVDVAKLLGLVFDVDIVAAELVGLVAAEIDRPARRSG